MNLRTRITATVVAISAAGTLALGGLAIVLLRNGQISNVDQKLAALVQQVVDSNEDPISQATFAVDESPIPTALGFAALGSDTVWLRTLPSKDVDAPTRLRVLEAEDAPITSDDGFRLRTLELPAGEHLLFASSLVAINQEFRNNALRLLLLYLPFNAALAAVISFFVSRNVRQMEQLVSAASGIAAGLDVDIPQGTGTSEARSLASSLDRLVLSLQQALELERASNRRMQDFLGDASHELRTPLTVIKGYLELLERPNALEGEQRDRAVSRMRSEAERMELLVNDLLLLAEIGSTSDEDFGEVDLTALLRVAGDDLRILQPQRTVTTNIQSGVLVRAVPSHLQRAVANVMANVRRHTPDDAPVNIDLHMIDHAVRFTIEDGGPGLPEASYADGISHFRRFDKSRSRSTGGSGLGMSIIAAVIAEASGSVALRPSALGGLAMDFELPLESEQAEPAS